MGVEAGLGSAVECGLWGWGALGWDNGVMRGGGVRRAQRAGGGA